MPGPTVTLFEIDIAKGVKVNRITVLADDLALALAASTVRILAPIPGKSLVGVEVPNERRTTVTLGDVIGGTPQGVGGPLMLAIGKDVAGDSVVADLSTMPHLLIAGSTGTGKSVCINAILVSLIMRSTPAEVRLILIDPKRIELSLYNGVPHLYVPVVTEPKEAASALAWAVSEMDSRLKKMQKAGARNIGMYNGLVQEGRAPEGAEEMPYLVIVIDELADLMMVAAKEVEDSICRLAQLARAAGIHLVVATQRPSTDIITGLIKTNIVNRIAFAVASSIDSRVILDQPGAEKLVGKGDMLYSTPEWHKPKRIQGAFVSEDEISAVVDHLKKQQAEPDYHDEILHLRVASVGGGIEGDEDDDPLLWEAADIVVASGIGSTSLLQRRLKVGYARAGRIMDMLEMKGLVGPPDGSKPREVLADIEDLESDQGVRASRRRARGALVVAITRRHTSQPAHRDGQDARGRRGGDTDPRATARARSRTARTTSCRIPRTCGATSPATHAGSNSRSRRCSRCTGPNRAPSGRPPQCPRREPVVPPREKAHAVPWKPAVLIAGLLLTIVLAFWGVRSLLERPETATPLPSEPETTQTATSPGTPATDCAVARQLGAGLADPVGDDGAARRRSPSRSRSWWGTARRGPGSPLTARRRTRARS